MNAKRILASLLCLCVVTGLMMVTAPSVHAAMSENSEGLISDGVDFSELLSQGNGIYYGTFAHATELTYIHNTVQSREENPTPILWLSMGEEANDAKITVLSKYVLDSRSFKSTSDLGSNYYNTSDIRTWLNGAGVSYGGCHENVW